MSVYTLKSPEGKIIRVRLNEKPNPATIKDIFEKAGGGTTPKPSLGQSLFPTASKAESVPGTLGKGLLDIISLIGERGPAATLTSQKLGDPNAFLLKKPVEAITSRTRPLDEGIQKGSAERAERIAGSPFGEQLAKQRAGSTLTTPPQLPSLTGIVDFLGREATNPLNLLGAGGGLKVIRGTKAGKVAKSVKNLGKQRKKSLVESFKKEEPVSIGELFDNGLKPSAAPKKTFKEKVFGRIKPQDRSILSEKLGPKDTEFTEYAIAAKKAVENARNPTPLDIAGVRAKEALDELGTLKSNAGAKKQAILEARGDVVVPITDVQLDFMDMVKQRTGGTFDTDGKLVSAGGRVLRVDAQQKALLEEMAAQISNQPFVMSAQKMDDLKAVLRNLVESKKATQAIQINSIAEGIGKNIRGNIDKRLTKVLGPKYKSANKEFAELATMQDELNRRIGNVVDGQPRMGASLLKSSLTSNSDRGSKVMFKNILERTGIDLIKEAKFAQIAMEGAGDDRIRSLLQDIGAVASLTTPKGLLVQTGKKGLEAVRQDPLDEIVEFYIKQQTRR